MDKGSEWVSHLDSVWGLSTQPGKNKNKIWYSYTPTQTNKPDKKSLPIWRLPLDYKTVREST